MNALDRFEAKFGLTNDTLLERSKLLVALEEFSSAKTILIDLIKSYKSPEVILLLSKCFSASDNIEETSKFKNILEENIKYFESNPAYWTLLALYARNCKDYQTALGACIFTLEKFDENIPQIWKILAFASFKLQDYEKVYEVCKTHLRKSELNSYLVEAYLNSCVNTGNYDEAVKFIDTTTFKWRETPIILGVLANLYGKLDQTPERQLQYNEKAFKIDPKMNVLGGIYHYRK